MNKRGKDYWTALHFAAANNPNPEVTRALIKAGANIEAQATAHAADSAGGMVTHGLTPLNFAAGNNNSGVVNVLLESGANPNAQSSTQMNINGKKINATKWTLFSGAANFLKRPGADSEKIIRALIKAGANINAKDDIGVTVLCSAVSLNNPELIDILIDCGADVNASDMSGATPLMRAVCGTCNIRIIKALLNAGADVNAKNLDGHTALHSAARSSNSDIIKLLISAGADIDAPAAVNINIDRIKTIRGSTPLLFAVMYNSPDVVKTLLEAGANPNAMLYYINNAGQAAVTKWLMGAVIDLCAVNPENIRALIKAGADVNARDSEGLANALTSAILNDNAAIIDILAENGADIYKIDDGPLSAYQIAMNEGCFKAAEALRRHGAY